MASILLPTVHGTLQEYEVGDPSPFALQAIPATSRHCYAAAHVVVNPLAAQEELDMESTLAFRRHLWSLGFSIAEAMDTAQRGMGLDWTMTQQLIHASLREARAEGALDRIACGAGTDQLVLSESPSLEDIVAAYLEQCSFIEERGGHIILMASRALAARATLAADYLAVYERVLAQVSQPVILHWLGDMFDPALTGYWGSPDLDMATEHCLELLHRQSQKIRGIKISLLNAEREIVMRRRLPAGMKMYTGDDFNYPELIAGDEQGFSDALLGIFDGIAPAAAAALQKLDQGNTEEFKALLEPTVALSRHIFQAPTRFYKTGLVLLAYLNGHQTHFHMVGGQQSTRSIVHLSELFRLADQARLLSNPEEAITRMRRVLALAGL